MARGARLLVMADDPQTSDLSPDQEDVRVGKLRNWADAYERCRYIRAGKKSSEVLTRFEEIFVNEFQVDFVATHAYTRAGGPARYPQQAAAKIMKRPKVIAALEELRQERIRRVQLQRDQIIMELANLTHTDQTQDLEVTREGKIKTVAGRNPLATRAVKRIRHKVSTTTIGDETTVSHEVDFDTHDKNVSARTLLQHFGALPEHVRIGDPNGNPLPTPVLVIREVDETAGGEKR